MSIRPYESDLTDLPLLQVALGGALGYYAGLRSGSTGAPDSVLTSLLGLLCYRGVHEMGFLELNLTRHPREGGGGGGGRRRSVCPPRGPGTFCLNLAEDNAPLVVGMAAGFVLARIRGCPR